MIQGYLLSIIYILFSAFLFLLDFYRQRLSFMLRPRAMLEEKKACLNAFSIAGFLLALALLFFPISPGPMIIGDLVPSVFILGSAAYFRIFYSNKNKDRAHFYYDGNTGHRKGIGFAYLVIAILHFLFPRFVLL